MELKISEYTSLEEAFRQAPGIVWGVALGQYRSLPFDDRFDLLRQYAAKASQEHSDDELLVVIQMMRMQQQEYLEASAVHQDLNGKHEARQEAHRRFSAWLEELFWELPDRKVKKSYVRDQDGSRYEDGEYDDVTLLESKKTIFRELLEAWIPEATQQSRYAFRRAIAMGWPLGKMYARLRNGEHEVELKSRGRFVGNKEQKAYAAAVRERLERHFDTYETRKAGTDAVFGPWLAECHVPEEIQKFLFMTRARVGGMELVQRDLQYGMMMEGIPESGLVVIEGFAAPMRKVTAVVRGIIAEVKRRGKERHWDFDPERLGEEVVFTDTREISISMKGGASIESMEELFDDARSVIERAHEEGELRCQVTIQVRPSYADDDTKPLTHIYHW